MQSFEKLGFSKILTQQGKPCLSEDFEERGNTKAVSGRLLFEVPTLDFVPLIRYLLAHITLEYICIPNTKVISL